VEPRPEVMQAERSTEMTSTTKTILFITDSILISKI
jgi:hypothetical protein